MADIDCGPCPFCGSEDTDWTWLVPDISLGIVFFAFCHVCGARGPAAKNMEQAAMLWNKSLETALERHNKNRGLHERKADGH